MCEIVRQIFFCIERTTIVNYFYLFIFLSLRTSQPTAESEKSEEAEAVAGNFERQMLFCCLRNANSQKKYSLRLILYSLVNIKEKKLHECHKHKTENVKNE